MECRSHILKLRICLITYIILSCIIFFISDVRCVLLRRLQILWGYRIKALIFSYTVNKLVDRGGLVCDLMSSEWLPSIFRNVWPPPSGLTLFRMGILGVYIGRYAVRLGRMGLGSPEKLSSWSRPWKGLTSEGLVRNGGPSGASDSEKRRGKRQFMGTKWRNISGSNGQWEK